MRVFVTGATGLLGNNVVRRLVEQGHDCRVLVRRQPRPEVFEGLDIEFAMGDLGATDVIDQSIARCDAVIHCAALIHLGWRREAESMLVNRQGTRTIVDSAIRHGKRLVHVGTVNTLGLSTRQVIADEKTAIEHGGGQVPCNYVTSKRASCEEVRQGVHRGLRAVIIHPGFMLGPYDWLPSSGRMIVELQRNWAPFYLRGGCSVCDVRDVAAGTIEALHRGGDDANEYILAGVNWTYKQLWTEICQRLHKPKPKLPVGPAIGFVAGRAGNFAAGVLGREGDVNSASVRMSGQLHWYRSDRAIGELGYAFRPPQETLDDAIAFIRRYHLSGRPGKP